MYDAIIAGAGPAGLSAALVLGRMRRRVLVCDTGAGRNAASHAARGVFTRDGTPPPELRRIAREQLGPYETVEVRDVGVADARSAEGRFGVTLADGAGVRGRRLLLATGMVDDLPAIDGLAELWGRGMHSCPYCDGWEARDRPLAALGNGPVGVHLALLLRLLSDDVVLCIDGPADLDGGERRRLAAAGITVREERVAAVRGRPDALDAIVFATGEALPRRALFLRPRQRQHGDLAARLRPDRPGLRQRGRGRPHERARRLRRRRHDAYVAAGDRRCIGWCGGSLRHQRRSAHRTMTNVVRVAGSP